ncbi:ly6/PLAUR domain-containing protein 5-like isoform X2 [Pseudophryne corroboree]|uniref:ly6/PLAUR domain-containing protein 5-like isoform X2 n=1 Tax=Pseudophryne corroboree TaxID=495146 RepID=UPI003081EAF2
MNSSSSINDTFYVSTTQLIIGAHTVECNSSKCNANISDVIAIPTQPPGLLCLECHTCNEAVEEACTETTGCSSGMSSCTGTIVYMAAGTRKETRIQKGCGTGVPSTVIASTDVYGFHIRGQKSECSTSNCNAKIPDFLKIPTETPGLDSSGNDLRCFSCISTNVTQCSDEVAEKVKCPFGFNTCYEAKGSLSIGDFPITLFVKQCSQFTSSSIKINTGLYTLSLDALHCSGNLCNGNLKTTVPPTTDISTTILPSPTTDTSSTILPSPTTDTFSTILSTPSENTTRVITTPRGTARSPTTSSSLTVTSPWYLLLLTLLLIASSL